MSYSKALIGYTKAGEEIIAYTISNSSNLTARIMNYGCNLLNLFVTMPNGEKRDVVLGYEKIEDYFVNSPGFGCCVTPNGNRIEKASFTLNGKTYTLDKNDGNNNLHSGFNPMHRKIWSLVSVSDNSISFKATKADLECGFPGTMEIKITYTLLADGIQIDYEGLSDEDTIFNPTNHSYFNLKGDNNGDILDHIVWLDADNYTYADSESIPHGEIVTVKGTPMDFTEPKMIGKDIDDISYDPLKWAGGYDHNYVLNHRDINKPCGYLLSREGKLKMEFYTDLPGMQFYTGNYLNKDEIGKGNKPYDRRYGVCFESQYHPNAINVPSFEQPVAKANELTKTTTIYKFSYL